MSHDDIESVLRVLEIIVIFFGGLGIVWRMSRMATKFEMLVLQQAAEVTDLKISIDRLIENGLKLDRMEERLLLEGKRLDRLEARFNHQDN